MNMCLLELAMCEKWRSNHFESEGGVGSKKFEDWGVKDFRIGGYQFGEGLLLIGGGQYPITCHDFFSNKSWLCNWMHAAEKNFVKTYLKALRDTFFSNIWNFSICDIFIQQKGKV